MDDASPADQTRASDHDREAALELLSTAASDGRLSPEEYSARADQALGARYHGELATLTEDLRGAPPAAPAEEALRISAVLSSQTRRGQWRVPAHLALRALGGDCFVELYEALLTSRITRIEARATCGSITIVVPEGVEVRLSGTALLGEKSSTLRGTPAPGAPVIDIHAKAFCGSIKVRPPSRKALRRLTEKTLLP